MLNMKTIVKLFTAINLIIFVPSVFAGSYSDENADSQGDTVQSEATKHWYVNTGINYYNFNFGDYHLPVSIGSASSTATSWSSTRGQNFESEDWQVQPSVAVGYNFTNNDPMFSKIFGQDESIEFRYSRSVNTGTDNQDYAAGTQANLWYIGGSTKPVNVASYTLDSSSVYYNQQYNTYGLYLTGKKIIQNKFINSPYIGFNIIALDEKYNSTMNMTDDTPSTFESTENDTLESYYYGLDFGDKFTVPFKRVFGAYTDVSASLMGLHSRMDATQVPRVGGIVPPTGQEQQVQTDDNKLVYLGKAEAGVTYYIQGYENPNSITVSLMGGVQYWSDVPYIDNPNGEGQVVALDYNSSVDPYAGLQLHVPLV